jgi:cell division control protein 24
MAHAPLLRQNTAPVFPSAPDGINVGRHQNTMSVATAPRTSQLSGSTAFNSTTSLSSLSTMVGAPIGVPPPNGGPVAATNNIINQKADASRSLYQICVSLKQRLAQVPGFEEYLEQLDQMSMSGGNDDPVESLWSLLRTGFPLLTIYNALHPDRPPLQIDERPTDTDEKRSKKAIMKFANTCVAELQIPAPERFIVNDLTGSDTTGFVKVRLQMHKPD